MSSYDTCLERIQYAKDVGLQALDLSFMGLTTLPEEITELKGLVELNLSNNSFTRLPFFINELTSLMSLHLRDNCFSYMGGIGFDIINNLQIEYIDLSLNNLSRIPEDIFYLSSLEEVELDGNPLMKGIPDLIIEQGIDAIHQFVEELYFSETTEKLLEAKLIFVGQGEVGKTSLMKKILNPHETIKVGYEPTTHGINVRRWSKEVYFSNYDLTYILKEAIEEDEEESDDDDEELVTYWERINEYYEIEEDVPEVQFSQDEDEYFNPLVDLFNTDTEKSNHNLVVRKQNSKTARFNIWDFGGQEIYYSTHQFF